MSLQETIINRFPSLYQVYFEKKTTDIIRKYETEDMEKRRILLGKMYEEKLGFPMNLENPVRYTDLMQIRKLYELNPEYSTLSDKIAVRTWVKEKIGEQYLIPLLGVWDQFDDIDFATLPDSFVLKTNNASATNIIVHDKEHMNMKLAKRKFDYWLQMKYWYLFGYEMQYESIPPKILAEQLIQGQDGKEIMDYKFLCFHGKVHYFWVDIGRHTSHTRLFFDRDFVKQPFSIRYPVSTEDMLRPAGYDEMLYVVEKLAEGFDHVRVDMYDNNGQIYFGEMTFTNASGFNQITPPEWNEKLGRLWKG